MNEKNCASRHQWERRCLQGRKVKEARASSRWFSPSVIEALQWSIRHTFAQVCVIGHKFDVIFDVTPIHDRPVPCLCVQSLGRGIPKNARSRHRHYLSHVFVFSRTKTAFSFISILPNSTRLVESATNGGLEDGFSVQCVFHTLSLRLYITNAPVSYILPACWHPPPPFPSSPSGHGHGPNPSSSQLNFDRKPRASPGTR